MARSKFSIYAFAIGALFAAAPVFAQIGPIFRDEPPRPPANVPGDPADEEDEPDYPDPRLPPPRQLPSYPGQAYPGQVYPGQAPIPPRYYPSQSERPPTDLSPNATPAQPQRPPANLPPPAGGSAIQSQELVPPPGTAPSPETSQDKPQTSAPGEPQQANIAPPAKEVVVAPPPMRIPNPTAVFSGLDKISGRIISFDVAINETVQFGALQVTPRVCYSRPPTELPTTDSFVEVDEVTLQGEIKRIFTGWMFAASPGLHAVEHPVYDVWLTDCKGAQNPAVAETSSNKFVPPKPTARPAPKTPRAPPPRGALPALR